MRVLTSRNLKESVIIKRPETTVDDYIKNSGYDTLKKSLFKPRQELIFELKSSGLRGRGGAAFPVGLKWETVASINAESKFVVCNADEGEPGTFKDRWILENRPHVVIEAIAICGYIVGAKKGFIYIRGEYRKAIKTIKKAVEDARKYRFLGANIFGSDFSFDIEIRKGAGSYVCGEETALLESIEGKRAHPRFKPPFPAVKGLWGKPTVVNNVETLANIVPIFRHGSEWFKQFGTMQSPGTKLFAVSGSLDQPALIEADLGITLGELLEECSENSENFFCALVGGAAGGFLYKKHLNVPLCYDSLRKIGRTLGSGAVMLIDNKDMQIKVVENLLEFFRKESCGKCIPCRRGYPKLIALFNEYLKSGRDVDEILEISNLMFKTSLCALGQSAIIPLKSFLEN